MPAPKIILASASPRRAELLRRAKIPFQVIVSPIEEPERRPAGIPLDLWPICLAYIKARAVQNSLASPQSKIKNRKSKIPIILAADTIVITDQNKILNKPRNRAHAKRMLTSLRGKTHRVITGIALLQNNRLRLASAHANCRIKNVSDTFLNKYLDSNLWQNKAGAYGIQDKGHDPFITLLSGDITTVIGLPLALVKSELAAFQKDRP